MVDSQIESSPELINALDEEGIKWKWNEDLCFQFNSNKDLCRATIFLKEKGLI